MPVRCEKVDTYWLTESSKTPVVIYELCNFTSRPCIQASRGPWLLAVHFAAVLGLDVRLTAANANKLIGLQPLSHFAPYRIGADGRDDVVAERSLGLCKYLDHVLKVTESPAPKELVSIVDDFVSVYWTGNIQRTLRSAIPSPAFEACAERSQASQDGAISDFSGRVRPGQMMLDTPSPPPKANLRLRSLQDSWMCRSLSRWEDGRDSRNRSWAPPARPALQVGDLTPQDKGAKTRNSGCVDEMRPGTPYRPLRLLPARLALEIPRWRQAAHQRPSHSARKHKEIPQDEAPLGAAPAARAHAKFFLEAVPPAEAGRDSCWLCRRRLKQTETGCVRLRTCGHELHASCFNALMSGCDKFPGVSRTACPKCGESWNRSVLCGQSRGQRDRQAMVDREQLSTLLGLGMTSKGIWGARRLG
ncbi:unnamed protein product [Durusdinium trenchii]|uniref:RING-type domain-containing protein n=1 Tax=Durusdinium trenchii TaxID=1381693 RepID=A0ABP0J7I7_9DINO